METLKSFLYFGKWNFSVQAQKMKKMYPEQNSLYFGKWNFLGLILKNLLHFLKRKFFLYFWNWKPEKIPYILQNGTFLYFRKQNFLNSKNKKTHFEKTFQEMELSNHKLKKLLIFQEELPKPQKANFSKKSYEQIFLKAL